MHELSRGNTEISSQPPKRKRRRYSLEDKERGLAALVLAAGSNVNASRMLASQGHDVPPSTVQTWREENPERYEQLRSELEPKIAEIMAAEAEAFVLHAGQVERDLLGQLHENRHDLKPAEIAGALRNVSTSKALQVDKISSPLRGRPTVIHERRDMDTILTALERAVGLPKTQIPETTTDAEVIEDHPTPTASVVER